jgi:CheY-specific phosphatase CheX
MSAAPKQNESHLTLDEDIARIINKAITETFGAFIGISPILKSSERHDKALQERYEISGIIAFIQESIEGTLAIRFKQDTILKLLSKVYGEELTALDNRVIGGVAEISNVIHGIAKEELNMQGYHYQMCLPVVIIGDNHSVVSALSGHKLVMRYDIDGEEAIIELVLHKQ